MKDLKIHDTLLGCFSAALSFLVLDLGLKMLDCRLQPRHATLGRTPERYAGADSPIRWVGGFVGVLLGYLGFGCCL